MQITTETLRIIISEELKRMTVISKDKDRREKESKKRSRDRKRSWDPDTYTLGRGIVSEEEKTITINEDTPVEELLAVIQSLKQENDQLQDQINKPLDAEKLKKLCNKKGLRSFKHYLELVNAMNRSEKGTLHKEK
jgi:hypothetical protein